MDSRLSLGIPLLWSEARAVAGTFRAQEIVLEKELLIADRGLVIPRQFGGVDVGVSAHFAGEKVSQGFSAFVWRFMGVLSPFGFATLYLSI